MSIVDRAALEESPLADLHTIASELSIDGYRRLRKPQLIEAILARQEGTEAPQADEDQEEPAAPDEAAEADDLADAEELAEAVADEMAGRGGETGGRRRRRGRRGGRARAARDEDADEAAEEERETAVAQDEEEREGTAAAREEDEREETAGARDEEEREETAGAKPGEEREETAGAKPGEEREPAQEPRGGKAEDEVVDGTVDLVGNGSAFVRAHPPEPSDDDVYISAAQVKRCELLSGDRISGPRRPPRRSERFSSMVRIDTINGRPAAEVADSTRFDDLPSVFADELLALGTDDPTITAITGLAPIGRGSRVTITGPARAGKTETLRRLAAALGGQDDLHVLLVLAGVRPEEIAEWSAGSLQPAGAVNFAASADAQTQLVEPVIDQARRWVARGSHAVVLIDTLDGLPPQAARKVLASARRIVDGGSLTVIATASEPLGGETTVIALDALQAAAGRFPALDVAASATLRPELLVGQDGAEAIARMRAQALQR
jgi:transcription termination factor Rho